VDEYRLEAVRAAEQSGGAFFDMLASMSPSAHPIRMFASTIVRAQVSAAGQKEAKRPDPRARARWDNDKNTRQTNSCGNLIGFDLTGGEASDGCRFKTLMNIAPDLKPRGIIADKGHTSRANRAAARARGTSPPSQVSLLAHA